MRWIDSRLEKLSSANFSIEEWLRKMGWQYSTNPVDHRWYWTKTFKEGNIQTNDMMHAVAVEKEHLFIKIEMNSA